ncbi:solute carrier family 13 member 5-like isoform X2 [Acanthaster planci]|nr:solute carrier family 13 member 5-like isoform X2 [Acanthaster planci]XP_022086472.1 solute carrier family 13 member 5-like isoform X2 [Acanthaster planci]XP_022086473.1 solute carrier family 13 member 5-like isoform X2 [Acanthaster planci]
MTSHVDPPPSWEEVIGPAEEQEVDGPGELPLPAPSRRALIWRNRRYFIVFLVPLILCPIPIVFNEPIGYTAYSILIMAIFWCTEAISLAVTALLPLVLFPLFGVMPAKDVAVQYFKDTNLLFFGGLMVAVAIEDCNLHRRIALAVLILVGSKPRWMMFGFMIITAFLSMWISNTATTAMMLPIAQAVLQQLKRDNLKQDTDNIESVEDVTANERSHSKSEEDVVIEMEQIQPNGTSRTRLHSLKMSSQNLQEDNEQEARYNLMCKGIVLCVPYAANIGGTATLTGTGPNLVMAGQVSSLFGSEAEVNFGEWMMYATPGMLLCLLLTWIWLQIVYVDRWCCRKLGGELDHKGAAKVIRQAYKDLGPMSFAEVGVLCHFVLLIVLWITREPGFVTGWSVLFLEDYVTDSTTVLFVAILLFVFPSRMPKFLCGRSSKEDLLEEKSPCPALLEWPVIHKKMAWLVVILLGGGFALAEGCKVSGLSAWIGDKFAVLDSLPPFAIALVVSVIIAGFTEVTSNVATATIFLPILASLGTSIGVNPLFLMLPATVACSFAFMLPVATPPNAIAFAYEQVTVMDMVKTGFMLNVICVFVANASINTLGMWIFDVGTFPDWAKVNVTAAY